MCVRTTAAHVYCDRMAGWIRMPLGTEVGLVLGDIVLDGLAFDFIQQESGWAGRSLIIIAPCYRHLGLKTVQLAL